MADRYEVELLRKDITCRSCSYNLRGLSSSGLCPECGTDIPLSIRAAKDRKARRVDLSSVDPQWAKSVAEGAIWSAIGLLIKCVAWWLPWSLYAFHSRSRNIILGLFCAAWVFEWLGAWKLASPQPGFNRSRGFWWSVRGMILLYGCLPFIINADLRSVEVFIVPVVIAALLGWLIACISIWSRLRWICSSVAVEWTLTSASLAIMVPLCSLVAMLPGLDGPEDSLSPLMSMPSTTTVTAYPVMSLLIGLPAFAVFGCAAIALSRARRRTAAAK